MDNEHLSARYFQQRYKNYKKAILPAPENAEAPGVKAVPEIQAKVTDAAVAPEPSKMDLVLQRLSEIEGRIATARPAETATPTKAVPEVPKPASKPKFGWNDDDIF